jgi:hypothetical protein
MKKLVSIAMAIMIMVCSVFSFTVSAKNKVSVSPPKVKSVSALDINTFKIKWSKVSKASGYILYCSVSGGKYKKIKKLGKNTCSYTHKKLVNNKKYSYKLRSYKKVKGKTYYSKFSNMKAKKCTNLLVNNYTPYSEYDIDLVKDGDYVKMAGDKYYNGIAFNDSYADVIYNLKGKYRYMSFTYGQDDRWSDDDKEISILSDDYCVKSFTIKSKALPKSMKVNIEKASKLEIKATSGSRAFLANIRLYK